MKMSSEDYEVMNDVYNQLEEHYYNIDPQTMFYDIEDELMGVVMNLLCVDENGAYKIVRNWYENRH